MDKETVFLYSEIEPVPTNRKNELKGARKWQITEKLQNR